MVSDAEIIDGPVEVAPEEGAHVFSYRVKRGEVCQYVRVVIPSVLRAAVLLGSPAGDAVATRGRSSLEESLRKGRTPRRISVDRTGVICEERPRR
jgi:hypothetical protein